MDPMTASIIAGMAIKAIGHGQQNRDAEKAQALEIARQRYRNKGDAQGRLVGRPNLAGSLMTGAYGGALVGAQLPNDWSMFGGGEKFAKMPEGGPLANGGFQDMPMGGPVRAGQEVDFYNQTSPNNWDFIDSLSGPAQSGSVASQMPTNNESFWAGLF